eukprot:TRINITY_DN3328_c1_g4_i3.p1 TRINITY_DN3328_c1_g4~~TRINITY_DN3328_c1_g4_i3.p1  ORF type:complete len:2281 (+),score=534.60 TRINITY_DN3328_c1_g4_i3:9-6851(+)
MNVSKNPWTQDFILNFIVRNHKLTITDEILLRIKICVSPTDSLTPTLSKISTILSPYIKDEIRDWSVLLWKTAESDEAIEVDIATEVKNLNFTLTARMRDLFLCDKKLVSKEKKRSGKKKQKHFRNLPEGIFQKLMPGEIIYFSMGGYLYLDESNPEPGSTVMSEMLVFGDVYFSNHRIFFIEVEGDTTKRLPDPAGIDIPYYTIARCTRKKIFGSTSVETPGDMTKRQLDDRGKIKYTMFSLLAKDVRQVSLAWESKKQEKEHKMFQKIMRATFVATYQDKFFMSGWEQQLLESTYTIVPLYSPQDQLIRECYDLDLASNSDNLWVVGTRMKNDSQNKKTSLPSSFICPKQVANNNQMISSLQLYRRRGIFPLYVWGNWSKSSPLYGCILMRSERPHEKKNTEGKGNGSGSNGSSDAKVSDTKGTELKSTESTSESYIKSDIVSDTDGKMMKILLDSIATSIKQIEKKDSSDDLAVNGSSSSQSSKQKIYVFDTGDESKTLEREYNDTCEYTFLKFPTEDDLKRDWDLLFLYHNVENKWDVHVKSMFKATLKAIDILTSNKNLLIQNGGPNYNGDSILSCLVQLCLDKYYRTLKGFCTLIDKEWVQLSYPYSTCSMVQNREQQQEQDFALSNPIPSFFLFMHCVYEMISRLPTEFEFNSHLLVFLMDSVGDARFSTFYFDSEKERTKCAKHTSSAWNYVLCPHYKDQFVNPIYKPSEDIIKIPVFDKYIEPAVWTDYLFRHSIKSRFSVSQLSSVLEKRSQPRDSPDSTPLNLIALDVTELSSPYWKQLSHITTLVIKNTLLSSIPLELVYLNQLKKLVIESSFITVASGVLSKLQTITFLSLRDNRLCTIDGSIGMLTALTTLNLASNKIYNLPNEMSQLQSLHELNLSQNNLITLPDSLSSMSSLHNLQVQKNQIVRLPQSLFSGLYSLEVFDIQENKLESLPESIRFLTNLRTLNVASNCVRLIPESLSQCTSLVEMNLNGNLIRRLPAAIGKLKNLVTLDVTKNLLMSIPPSISGCVSLQFIHAAENSVTWMPFSIGRLPKLTKLNLTKNCLVHVTCSLGACTSLRELIIKENSSIAELPPNLSALSSSLKTLRLEGTAFLNLNPHLLEANTPQDVMSYLKSLFVGQYSPYRMKLVFLGEDKAGKSMLASHLTKEWEHCIVGPLGEESIIQPSLSINTYQFPFSETHNEGDKPTTAGGGGVVRSRNSKPSKSLTKRAISRKEKLVAASPYGSVASSGGGESKNNKQLNATIHVWDFLSPGDVYQVSHQYFSSGKTIYIVCFNIQDQNSELRLEFWLRGIKSRDPEPYIIIVGTHLSRQMSLANVKQKMKDIKTKYSSILRSACALEVALVSSDAKETYGIGELRKTVETMVLQHRKMNDSVPLKFLLFENLILELRTHLSVPLVTYEQFKDLASFCGINDVKSLNAAIKFLHDVGTIVYFDFPTLSHMVVFDPRWLVTMTNKMFHTRYVRRGILLHAELHKIWGAECSSEAFSWLLSLLQKYDVVYELKGGELDNIREMATQTVLSPSGNMSLSPDVSVNRSSSDQLLMVNSPSTNQLIVNSSSLPTINSSSSNPTIIVNPSNSLPTVPYVNDSPTSATTGRKLSIPLTQLGGSATNSPLTTRSAGGTRSRGCSVKLDEPFAPIADVFKGSHEPMTSRSETTRYIIESFEFSELVGTPAVDNNSSSQDVPKGVPKLDSEGASLIPSLLSVDKPEVLNWLEYPQDYDPPMYQLDRTYHFSFLPKNFLSRFLLRTIHLVAPQSIWSTGMLAASFAGDILIEQKQMNDPTTTTKSLASNGGKGRKLSRLHASTSDVSDDNAISLFVRSESKEHAYEVFSILTSILDEVAGNNLAYTRTVTSPNSIVSKLPPTYVSIDAIEELVVNGKSSIKDCDDVEIEISVIAPDIALSYYNGRRISYDEINSQESPLVEIAEGGFAKVYKGTYMDTPIAAKKLKTGNSQQYSKAFKEFRQEINIQSRMSHPNVVNLMCICINPFCMILEYVPHGNLWDLIHDYNTTILWELKIKFATDLAHGIKYLHELDPPVAHLDMKSPNLMVVSTDPTHPVCLKIADFGTSKLFTGKLTGRSVDLPVWLAPEIISGKPYDLRVDTYAYGIILWELSSRVGFFEEMIFLSDLEEAVLQGDRPQITNCPKVYQRIIEKCWSNDPEERPSYDWILTELDQVRSTDFTSLNTIEVNNLQDLLEKKKKKEEEERQQEELMKELEKKKEEEWFVMLDSIEEKNTPKLHKKGSDKFEEEEEWTKLRDNKLKSSRTDSSRR